MTALMSGLINDLDKVIKTKCSHSWSVGLNVDFGYRGRRFEPRQQYVVSLSMTLSALLQSTQL